MTAAEETLRAGVVGLGKLGLLHAGIVNALAGVKLTAIAENSGQVAKILRNVMPGVAVHNDHRSLLADGNVDVVFIATPTGTHVDIAMDCAARSLPFFVEKPLSLSVAQALPLVNALRDKPLPNMVGYMTRYQAPFAKARAVVQTGALGTPEMVRASMYVAQLFQTGKGWRFDKAVSGGGVLATQNTHLVDLLLWLFGPVREVSGHTRALYSQGVEDSVHAHFRFESGLTGYMDCSWSARHFRSPTIQIHMQGTNGTIDINDDGVALHLETQAGGLPAGWSHWTQPDLYRGVSFDIGGPHYTLQAEDFIAAVRRRGTVASDVVSACRTQAVIDAIYRSAELSGAPQAVAAEGLR